MLARLVLLSLFLFSSILHADVRFASWNIKHFGWNNGKEIPVLASIASGYDLIAIQELMDPSELRKLESELEGLTGESWTQMASSSVGRSTYREHYGFLWRNSEVSYLDGAVVYIDSRDAFIREPYSARFLDRDASESFAVSTVHILFGDSVSDRTPEIKALASYWEWLEDIYPEDKDRLILAGDFNLAPDHLAWSPLKEHAKPLVTRGKTTLSKTDGKFSSLYDNIWVSKSNRLDVQISGIFKFTGYMDTLTGRFWSNEEARDKISDHAPVYALIGTSDASFVSLDPGIYSSGAQSDNISKLTERQSQNARGSSCVDLNSSPASDLQKIPYIGSKRVSLVVSGRPWKSVDSLTRIRGIGPATLTRIKSSGIVCEI